MKLHKILLMVGLVTAFTLTLLVTPVHAEPKNIIGKTFVVNSTADEVDANIGDGNCKTASKKCTLRAAIQESNMLLGPNTILLPKGYYPLVISGDDDAAAMGDLDILDSVTIRGESPFLTAIDGNELDRIFHIVEQSQNVQVIIEHVNLFHGKSKSGGAIWNGETLTLDHVLVQNNTALLGGGIFNNNTLYVRYSVFDENKTGSGGALFNAETAVAYFMGSTLGYNQANAFGGAIYNAGGAVSLVNSTIAKNGANWHGGGIYNDMVTGKSNYVDLRSVTVSGNRADDDSDNNGNGGGIFNKAGATTVVFDTVLAQNVDKSIVIDPVLLHHDCSGALSEGDYGYNLLAVPNGCTGLVNGQKGDHVGTSNAPIQAKLNNLADNGGPTPTMVPANDSPLVNAGDPGNCSNDTNGVDQRGYARVVGNKCDIGAVEVGASCAGKPEKPIVFTPYSGQPLNKTNVTLKWLGANCATTYQIRVRQDSKQGAVVADIKGISTVSQTLNGLAKGHTYFWQVKACNGAKCKAGSWSSFKIKP